MNCRKYLKTWILRSFLILVFGGIFLGNSSKAEAAETGSICGYVKTISKAGQRDSQWYYEGYLMLYNYVGIPVKLVNEDGDVVATTVTAGSTGAFAFTDVPINETFYVLYEDTDINVFLTEFPGFASRLTKPITLTRAGEQSWLGVDGFAIRRPIPLQFISEIGSFEQDTEVLVKNIFKGEVIYNADRNAYLVNDGILPGDKINTRLGNVPQVFLSEADRAYGYKQIGWKQYGTDAVISDNDVLDVIARGSSVLSFQAVYSYPEHRIEFHTNNQLGTLTGATSQVIQGDTVITSIPEVTPAEGYQFVGWITDLSENIVTNEEIVTTILKSDRTYYAKYQPVQCKVISQYVDENGNEIAKSDEYTGAYNALYFTADKNILGYRIEKVVGNLSGKFGVTDQTVQYVYKKLDLLNPTPPQNLPNNNLLVRTSFVPMSTLPNGPTKSLPETGEEGSILYRIVGILSLASLSVYFIKQKADKVI